MEFRVFVERDGVGRQRDAAGQSRRKAVAGVLGLVCVAVLALASRGGDGTVEMAGKEYAVEENYETSFLEQAAALGNLGARTHERKTKLVPARRQDKTWGNVGARAERNIFGAAGAASGDAAVGHALSAVSKARAELRGLQKTSAFISLADAPAWKNAFAQKDTNVFDHSGDPTYLGADDPRLGTPAPSAATPLMADGRPGPRVQHPTDGGSGATDGFDIDTTEDDLFHGSTLPASVVAATMAGIPKGGSLFVDHVTDNGSPPTSGFTIDTSVDDFFTHHAANSSAV